MHKQKYQFDLTLRDQRLLHAFEAAQKPDARQEAETRPAEVVKPRSLADAIAAVQKTLKLAGTELQRLTSDPEIRAKVADLWTDLTRASTEAERAERKGMLAAEIKTMLQEPKTASAAEQVATLREAVLGFANVAFKDMNGVYENAPAETQAAINDALADLMPQTQFAQAQDGQTVSGRELDFTDRLQMAFESVGGTIAVPAKAMLVLAKISKLLGAASHMGPVMVGMTRAGEATKGMPGMTRVLPPELAAHLPYSTRAKPQPNSLVTSGDRVRVERTTNPALAKGASKITDARAALLKSEEGLASAQTRLDLAKKAYKDDKNNPKFARELKEAEGRAQEARAKLTNRENSLRLEEGELAKAEAASKPVRDRVDRSRVHDPDNLPEHLQPEILLKKMNTREFLSMDTDSLTEAITKSKNPKETWQAFDKALFGLRRQVARAVPAGRLEYDKSVDMDSKLLKIQSALDNIFKII